jgi:hypothetical protein
LAGPSSLERLINPRQLPAITEDDQIKPDPRTQEDGVKGSDQLTLIHRFFPAYKDVCCGATDDAKKWKALAVKIIMAHPLFKDRGVQWVRYSLYCIRRRDYSDLLEKG